MSIVVSVSTLDPRKSKIAPWQTGALPARKNLTSVSLWIFFHGFLVLHCLIDPYACLMLMCVITPARQALCCHLDAVPLLLLCLAPDKLLNCCLLLLYIFLNSLPKPIGKECLPHPQRVYHHFLGVLSTVMVPEFQLLEAYCVQVLHTTPSGSSVNVGWVAMFNLGLWSRSSCTWCVA